MGKLGVAVWTGIGAAFGVGVGIAGTRLATMNMPDGNAKYNVVLAGAVLGGAVGGATAATIAAPKQLGA